MEEQRYQVTETVLAQLKEQGIQPDLLEALRQLVGRSYPDEKEFLAALYSLVPCPSSDREAAAILRVADRDFQRAVELLESAYRHHMDGALEEAIAEYRESLSRFPIAEAHTFLGWAYSFQNRYQEAIQECERAISLDPDFGNPYNDIGAYLISLGEYEQAIPWLTKATEAARYEPRHFPWANLGRVFELLDDPERALDNYLKAFEIAPDYAFAREAIERLSLPPERLN